MLVSQLNPLKCKSRRFCAFILLSFAFLFLLEIPSLAVAAEPVCSRSDVLICEDFDDGDHVGWTEWDTVCHFCTPCAGNPTTDCEGISSLSYVSPPYAFRQTIEAGENDGSYPHLAFPEQASNEWTHVRFYRKFDTDFAFGPQYKGQYIKGGADNLTVVSLQVRDVLSIPGYATDGHYHFGFHWYTGGETFIGVFNVGQQVYPESIVGQWHCFEYAVKPSTGSLKFWIDGDLKMDYTGLGFPNINPNDMWFANYWGMGSISSPRTQSQYIDNIVVAKSYIGPITQTEASDSSPPVTSGHSPAKNATGVPANTNISLHVLDSGDGVNRSSIVMTVNGQTVTPTITGSPADYTVSYDPPVDFSPGQTVTVTLDASDLHNPPNVMPKESYSFTVAADTTPPAAPKSLRVN